MCRRLLAAMPDLNVLIIGVNAGPEFVAPGGGEAKRPPSGRQGTIRGARPRVAAAAGPSGEIGVRALPDTPPRAGVARSGWRVGAGRPSAFGHDGAHSRQP